MTVEMTVKNEEILRKKLNIPPTFKAQFRQLRENGKKVFLPGSIEELKNREFEMNKLKSKRSLLKKLIAPLTILGMAIIILVSTWAIFSPWVSPYSFAETTGVFPGQYMPPSAAHPLGTALFGRDVYARLIWGARTSLLLSLSAITISVVGGVITGLIAAFYGGWVDNVIMRIMDVFMAFPGLILTIVVVAIVGRTMENIMLVFGVLGIPGYSRLMRGAALTEVNKPYVQTARVAGASNLRIIFKHVFSNSLAPIIVQFTFDIGGMILSLAGLGFLGFSDPKMVEWGADISDNKGKLYSAFWAPFWPGVGILITVLGFMLLGDGLRDAFDPRLKH